MLCNVCNLREATIHLTEIVNDQMVEIHLCENCAQEKGTDFKTHFNLTDLLGGLIEADTADVDANMKKVPLQCATCGTTYEEFGKSGRLGCAKCYAAFSKLLIPLIKRLQRSIQHVGKRPANVSSATHTNHDLRLLREKLAKKVQMEEFEEAAKIRDRIKQLEEKSKKPRKKKSE